MQRDGFFKVDNASVLITIAAFVLLLACLPLALRLDEGIDRDRPMYTDLSRMATLQNASLVATGAVVPVELSGGETAEIGEQRVRRVGGRVDRGARRRRRHGVLHLGQQRARTRPRTTTAADRAGAGCAVPALSTSPPGFFTMGSDLLSPRPPPKDPPVSWRSVLHSRPVLVLGVVGEPPGACHDAAAPPARDHLAGARRPGRRGWSASTSCARCGGGCSPTPGSTRRWHMRAYAESELLGLVTPGPRRCRRVAAAPAHPHGPGSR